MLQIPENPRLKLDAPSNGNGNRNGNGNGHRTGDGNGNANDHHEPNEPTKFLEIDTAAPRRAMGALLFFLFFAVVAGAVAWVFYKFTGSALLSIFLVLFMVGYMTLMGHLAGKNLSKRDSLGSMK